MQYADIICNKMVKQWRTYDFKHVRIGLVLVDRSEGVLQLLKPVCDLLDVQVELGYLRPRS